MKIAIASDHAGFCLKYDLKKALPEIDWQDFGAPSPDSVDYPDTGYPAARAVANGECQLGVLICGSGIGMSIVANKVHGIRAALCVNKEYAVLSRKHNNANILVLPGRFITSQEAVEILEVWLATEFEGGRHQQRIDKIEV
jgi:ribose 5-phosphate isomerase B